MTDDSTSPQTLAMLELLSVPTKNTPAVEGQRGVITLSGEQASLFKAVASCMAQGMGVERASLFLNQSQEKVRLLFKHAQVLEELKNLTQSEGHDQAVKNVLKGTVLDSIFRLVHLRDTAKSESVQYNSATKLIALAADNPDEQIDNLPDDPLERKKELMRRIERLGKNL